MWSVSVFVTSVAAPVVRRRGSAIDIMRQRGRQRRDPDGEGHQGAAPEVGPEHQAFPREPTDTSLLERRPKPTLKVAAHGSKLIGWVPPMLPRKMNDWLVASGLSSLQHTYLARVDTHLLSAFVERWGELVDPNVVVTDYDAIHLVVELFGVSLSDATTEASTVRGPYYKLDWLKQIFEQQRAANNFTSAMRAYMMLLLGCTILADKTFTLVEAKYLPLFRDLSTCGRYCWGAAALCWIHEYFPTVGKRGTSGLCGIDSPMARAMKWEYRQGTQKVADIRAVLDQLTPHDIVWRPFEDHRVHRPVDDICLYRVCMRQFGYRQYIPTAPPNVDTLDVDVEWATYMQSVLQVIRSYNDPPAAFATMLYETDDDYLPWYCMVSHHRLRAPRDDRPMEVPVPVYDEGLSYPRLSYISHELHHYLQRHQAVPEDEQFLEIFRALRLAQGGPLPSEGPITYDNESD
ncbi:protein MAIN-LIKE 1-like [Vicia villosa]|uniref:protein MAIN-LIKE 1-like n=1 Tax=Vicia villosa TaxID=3911 RepID=UPI00273C94D0|nr:protein MAIN-LIKE 1-like [Vicia villosa]